MKNIIENNVIRFINITRKKDGLYANFKARGIKGGATFSASVSIELDSAEVTPGDTLEKIIDECAKIAVKEFKKSDLQFEGLAAV